MNLGAGRPAAPPLRFRSAMGTRGHSGYTLLETLIAVTVALIVSAMTVPNLLRLS